VRPAKKALIPACFLGGRQIHLTPENIAVPRILATFGATFFFSHPQPQVSLGCPVRQHGTVDQPPDSCAPGQIDIPLDTHRYLACNGRYRLTKPQSGGRCMYSIIAHIGATAQVTPPTRFLRDMTPAMS